MWKHAPAGGGVALVLADLAGAQDLEVGDADRAPRCRPGTARRRCGRARPRRPGPSRAPLLVDQQVAAVAVLDRDRRRRVVEDALQPVGLDAQVLVARGQRHRHRVERLRRAGRSRRGRRPARGCRDGRAASARRRRRRAGRGASTKRCRQNAEQDQQRDRQHGAGRGQHDHARAQRLGRRRGARWMISCCARLRPANSVRTIAIRCGPLSWRRCSAQRVDAVLQLGRAEAVELREMLSRSPGGSARSCDRRARCRRRSARARARSASSRSTCARPSTSRRATAW